MRLKFIYMALKQSQSASQRPHHTASTKAEHKVDAFSFVLVFVVVIATQGMARRRG